MYILVSHVGERENKLNGVIAGLVPVDYTTRLIAGRRFGQVHSTLESTRI